MNASVRRAVTILSLGLLILSPLSLANAASGKVEVVNLRGPLVNAWFTSVSLRSCCIRAICARIAFLTTAHRRR